MVKTKTALDQTSGNFANQTPILEIESEKDEALDQQRLKGKAVVIIDPSSGTTVGNAAPLHIQIADSVTPSLVAFVQSANQDLTAPGLASLYTAALAFYYNNLLNQFERVRTPTVFKNAVILNNGSTAIWTSGVGKKWRLMGICITLMQGTTAAAASKLSVLDVAADTGIGVTICSAAMTAVLNATVVLNISLGNGILAAATNTALNINLSSALAICGANVQVWGTEE